MKKIILLFMSTIFYGAYSLADSTTSYYGIASYYGTYFHGKKTASGEKYDQYKLTAAHKTLPLGTIVKVTNTSNSKSVILKVNDRGPYVKGRIIDVSTKAAELLGFRQKGTTHVKVEVISDKNGYISEEQLAEDSQKNVSVVKESAYTENEKLSWKDVPTFDDNNSQQKNPSNNFEIDNNNDAIHRNYYDMVNIVGKNNAGMYGIDLGGFYTIDELMVLIKQLQTNYNEPIFYEEVGAEGQKSIKLFVGTFQNIAYAEAFKLKLSKQFANCEVVKF